MGDEEDQGATKPERAVEDAVGPAEDRRERNRRPATGDRPVCNIADFPPASVEPFDIEVIHPDTFLLDQLDLAPTAVLDELARQAAANRREPRTGRQILDALARAGAPAFADEVRRRIH